MNISAQFLTCTVIFLFSKKALTYAANCDKLIFSEQNTKKYDFYENVYFQEV